MRRQVATAFSGKRPGWGRRVSLASSMAAAIWPSLIRVAAASPRTPPIPRMFIAMHQKPTGDKIAGATVSIALPAFFDFCPSVLQSYRSVENRFAWNGIVIRAEVAEAFELKTFTRRRVGEGWFEFAVNEKFEGVGIESALGLRCVGIFVSKERFVEPDFRIHRMSRRYPMDGRLHFPAIGRVTTAGCGIVRAVNLDEGSAETGR